MVKKYAHAKHTNLTIWFAWSHQRVTAHKRHCSVLECGLACEKWCGVVQHPRGFRSAKGEKLFYGKTTKVNFINEEDNFDEEVRAETVDLVTSSG